MTSYCHATSPSTSSSTVLKTSRCCSPTSACPPTPTCCSRIVPTSRRTTTYGPFPAGDDRGMGLCERVAQNLDYAVNLTLDSVRRRGGRAELEQSMLNAQANIPLMESPIRRCSRSTWRSWLARCTTRLRASERENLPVPRRSLILVARRGPRGQHRHRRRRPHDGHRRRAHEPRCAHAVELGGTGLTSVGSASAARRWRPISGGTSPRPPVGGRAGARCRDPACSTPRPCTARGSEQRLGAVLARRRATASWSRPRSAA